MGKWERIIRVWGGQYRKRRKLKDKITVVMSEKVIKNPIIYVFVYAYI